MNQKKLSKSVYLLLITIGLSIGTLVQSQTVVQWYTSMGEFRAQLREDLVPMTAQNFIDLTNANFYDDLIFHRVIIEFMIQDGCPYGNGTGGPGYTFDDEFHPDLRHDEPGILSMANSGPNTNGSQYFITVVPTDWLDDVHSVFGKIIDGLEVVYAISEVETDGNDKPLIDVVIDSIRVVTGDPQLALTGPIGGAKWNSSVDNEITWDSEFVADVKIEFSSDNGATWSDVVESQSANTRTYSWPPENITSTECLVKISDVANPDVFDISDSFTLCQLDLTNPTGFGFYRAGSPIDITWTSEMVGDLSISYKPSADDDWLIIEEGIPASSGSYNWVPEDWTDWCKVRITETAFPDVSDETGDYFIIFQLDLTAPAGGENMEGNSQFDIEWESEIITTVKIEFSSDNGQNWSTIAGSTGAGNSPYTWNVPNINSDECFVKLTTPSLPDLYSMNEIPFSIVEYTGVPDHVKYNTIEFELFPNPVGDEAFVSLLNPEEWKVGCEVEIYTVSGELMYTRRFSANDRPMRLELENLPKGLYLIKIFRNNKSSSLKFVKK